jgi:hypothetical protein
VTNGAEVGSINFQGWTWIRAGSAGLYVPSTANVDFIKMTNFRIEAPNEAIVNGFFDKSIESNGALIWMKK